MLSVGPRIAVHIAGSDVVGEGESASLPRPNQSIPWFHLIASTLELDVRKERPGEQGHGWPPPLPPLMCSKILRVSRGQRRALSKRWHMTGPRTGAEVGGIGQPSAQKSAKSSSKLGAPDRLYPFCLPRQLQSGG